MKTEHEEWLEAQMKRRAEEHQRVLEKMQRAREEEEEKGRYASEGEVSDEVDVEKKWYESEDDDEYYEL